MLRHRLGTLLVWLALFAYGLTAGLPGSGIVLCLEADGHVTIEMASSGCSDCCPAGEAPEDAGIRIDSCPCIDVALVGVEVLPVKTKTSEVAVAGPAFLAIDGLLPAAVSAPKRASRTARPDAHRNSSIELVSCVVLRV